MCLLLAPTRAGSGKTIPSGRSPPDPPSERPTPYPGSEHGWFTGQSGDHPLARRSLFRYVFAVGEQRSTMALFTARADGRSATPAPLDFCKACLWQVMDASIDLRDPNPN